MLLMLCDSLSHYSVTITVEALINGVLFKPTLINTGYKCYSIMDKDLIIKLRLLHVKNPA